MTTKTTDLQDALVAAVRANAMKYYEKGWDVVVECWSDAEIIEVIGRSTTARGAILKMYAVVSVYIGVKADIVATAF